MFPRYLVNFQYSNLPVFGTDYLVIGSGIAGLYTALKAVEYGRVTLLTKRKVEDSNTEQAQGGIAAAIDRGDSPSLHMEDTLKAGAGLNDLKAVEVLVSEGPARVEELIRMGTAFDRCEGEIAFGREGAHSRCRILHACGDATGEEIRRTLWRHCQEHGEITVFEGTQVIDVLVNSAGECYGVLAWQAKLGLHIYHAKVTVLATGGNGQLYKNSTNPEVTTGDGIAAAFRAGAEVMDLEFVQFHPTALTKEGAPPFLISEAVRGEGAQLFNSKGERFMPRYHELAELAPRNVVSLAIWQEMANTGAPAVFLKVAGEHDADFAQRFPTIHRKCLYYGIKAPAEMIPVAPAAHYLMGGIRSDLWGRTNIPRLFACGEAACNGVHGANRLASNSLLEGLVFGARIVEAGRQWLDQSPGTTPAETTASGAAFASLPSGELPAKAEGVAQAIQQVMWERVGLWRSARGLITALADLERIALPEAWPGEVNRVFETANMLLLACLTARAALLRVESRGAHYRVDAPQSRNLWCRHIVQSQ
ncbi:MAG: L-aspartate oxidase [Heliobacteriaceae bacterium]|nr:L-aspartate oxidase [Heliobacteriaceae bacterium]MDD4587957.1 L-aspartate oxidase [Heliobacteriaceae bacterium]